jgi:hypothetical protein
MGAFRADLNGPLAVVLAAFGCMGRMRIQINPHTLCAYVRYTEFHTTSKNGIAVLWSQSMYR